MNRLVTLIIFIFSFSFIFGGKVQLNKELNSSIVKLSLVNSNSTNKNVKGLQFDLNYNPTEIKFENAKSLLDGFTFEFSNDKLGVLKCLIFRQWSVQN